MITDTHLSPEGVRERAIEMAAVGNYEIARLLREVADEMERGARERPRRVPRGLRSRHAHGPMGEAAAR